MTYQLAVLALNTPFPEPLFPGSSELLPRQSAEVRFPGGSGLSKRVVVVPDPRVFIPPCLPTVILFLPALNYNICSPSLPSTDSHQLESKYNPSIQVWSDSL
jgi:hypothetical protein